MKLTIHQLTQTIKTSLQNIGLVWITGEVASITLASSGHWYMTLKDEYSQIKCVMFKQKTMYSSFTPKQGQTIEVYGQIELYEARGDIQIIAESIRPVGIGALYEAFLALKSKLEKLGMFETKYKKSLPHSIKKIGIVTSLEAAALADVLKTMRLKVPFIEVYIYPCMVQGIMASKTIVQQIELANEQNIVDALIICRGGGSLEDLSAYNDENLAIAIFNSDIPIITGIGHETDTSIADLVSSHRCATPTACVDMLGQNITQRYEYLSNFKEFFKQYIQRFLINQRQNLNYLAYPFKNNSFIQKHREKLQTLRNQININLSSKKYHIQSLKQSINSQIKLNLLNLRNNQAKYINLLAKSNPHLKINLTKIHFINQENTLVENLKNLKIHTNYTMYFNNEKALVSFEKIENQN